MQITYWFDVMCHLNAMARAGAFLTLRHTRYYSHVARIQAYRHMVWLPSGYFAR